VKPAAHLDEFALVRARAVTEEVSDEAYVLMNAGYQLGWWLHRVKGAQSIGGVTEVGNEGLPVDRTA
jgi:hypothetical protein